jgi:hypothetical protein
MEQRRGALSPDTTGQRAADTIYAVACDESVFLRLTRECGWTPEDYADLIARTLNATLGTNTVVLTPADAPTNKDEITTLGRRPAGSP